MKVLKKIILSDYAKDSVELTNRQARYILGGSFGIDECNGNDYWSCSGSCKKNFSTGTCQPRNMDGYTCICSFL